MADLENTARALVAEGKGILAADESTGTIKKRFDSIGVESTEDNRRAYRDLLFTTEGVEEYISGVILFDETIRQSSLDGTPFPKLLESRGVIPGIKVDAGAKPLALAEGETITEGLDGLRGRLEEYRGLGARFAKWRAVITIGKGILAADESDGTIKKRFDSIGIESTEENRRAYRDMLFTTPGSDEFISGVILFDETIR
ncbi:MAG: class I fructose-bisphosphate aldolase, partial [Gaiellaceae bacterium]